MPFTIQYILTLKIAVGECGEFFYLVKKSFDIICLRLC